MKSKGTAYLLWFIGCFGILGLQHFYLGNYVKGIIWLLTLGILGVGAFIDLFTLGSAVEQHNTKEELKTIRTASLASLSK
jgi:TM2 domain-containing membrane protein YozV